MIHEIHDDTFDEEIAHCDTPCLIEFTAEWCQPCAVLAPAYQRLSERYGAAVKFCRVDTDKERALRIKFAVAVLPYLVWVQDGTKTPLFDRLVTEDELAERIEYMLSGKTAPTTSKL